MPPIRQLRGASQNIKFSINFNTNFLFYIIDKVIRGDFKFIGKSWWHQQNKRLPVPLRKF